MDIPYHLEEQEDLRSPPCKFNSIWKVKANHSYQPRQANGFETPGLFVTYEGQGILDHSGRCDELDAGTVFFIPDATPCSYRCKDDDWKFYFLEFSGLDMARSLGLPVEEILSSGRIPDAILLCERMIDNLITKPSGYGYTADILLQELLLLFARELPASKSIRYPELDAVLFYLHKNIGKPFRIDDLLRQTELSRTAFFARFRAMTGQSPNRYMQELKLASAKASLETTNLSIKEIASALCFYDEFHFSKMFKKRYGTSPSSLQR
jgi:AraC-like DNA-binding protein